MQSKSSWMDPNQFEEKWRNVPVKRARMSRDARGLEKAFASVYKRLDGIYAQNQPLCDAAIWVLENRHRVLRDLMTLCGDTRCMPKLPYAVFQSGRAFRIADAAQMALDLHAQGKDSRQIAQAFHTIIQKGLLTQQELWQLHNALRYRLLAQLLLCADQLAQGREAASEQASQPIRALYALDRVLWREELAALNPIDQLFQTDCVYAQSDVQTQRQLCDAVAALARKTTQCEMQIAQSALLEAKRLNSDVSYCLLGQGSAALHHTLDIKRRFVQKKNAFWYMLTVYTLTCIGSLLLWRPFGAPSLLLRIEVWGVAILIANRIYALLFRPKRLPRLRFEKEIDPKYRTMAAVVSLVTSPQDAQRLADHLESLYLANRQSGLCFALVGDFCDAPDEDQEQDLSILTAIETQIRALNQKYHTDIFCAFHRKRTLTPDGVYQGWERKRGAVMTLVRTLCAKQEDYLVKIVPEDYLTKPFRYLIVLDADSQPYPGSLAQLPGILAHPMQNRYAIVSVRSATASSTVFTKLQAMLGQDAGMAAYRGVCTSLYQDMAGEGIFCGKGILDIRKFLNALDGKIPDQRVLSHDLLEGLYAKCAYASDILFFDAVPSTAQSYYKRQERWIRGDFQLLPWLFSGKNKLSGLDRWKIADNLRRWLTPPLVLAALLVLCALGDWLAALVCVLLYYVILPRNTRMMGLALLPFESCVSLSAAARALWRVYVSKRQLLSWTTAAETEKQKKRDKTYLAAGYGAALAVAVLSLPRVTGLLLAIPLALLWCYGTVYYAALGEPQSRSDALTPQQLDDLRDLARRTYLWFETVLTSKHHYLPPDNEQAYPAKAPAPRTSPTNIGFSLCAHAAAYCLGFIGPGTLYARILRTFQTILQLENWNGHLYNWYDTQTLKPLEPRYVSTVDCGNLCACLLLCAQVLDQAPQGRWDPAPALSQVLSIFCADGQLTRQEAQKILQGKMPQRRLAPACLAALSAFEQQEPVSRQDFSILAQALRRYVAQQDFSLLYDQNRRLFFIGYDVSGDSFGASHYDLLASEARLTSLLAIAKGDVPANHYEALGRPAVCAHGMPVLLSWSGTLFEYLMPQLFLKEPAFSAGGQAARSAVEMQQKQGALGLWGKSESGYYRFDDMRNYQYHAFGLRSLSVRSDLYEKNVFAPYAVLLSLPVKPRQAMEQLDVMRKFGLCGRFGMYEAIDVDQAGARVVASYMAHHQAMGLMAMEQVLCGTLQKQFMQVPMIRAWSLLSDETLPKKLPRRPKLAPPEAVPVRRRWEKQTLWADPKHLEAAAIGDERAGMIFFGARNCLSIHDIQINRAALPDSGIAVRLHSADKTLALGAQPRYQFSAEMIQYQQSMPQLDISARYRVDSRHDRLEITVTVSAKGHAASPVRVDLYWEPLLAHARQDGVHPAFSDLFLSLTPYENGVVAVRKPRGEDPAVYAYAACSGADRVIHALDRSVYLGRGGVSHWDGQRSVPQGVQPCVALCAWLEGLGREKREIVFEIGLSDGAAQARRKIEACGKSSIPEQRPILDDTLLRAGARLCALLFSGGPARVAPCEPISPLRDLLWRFGVSGDHPYLVLLAGQDAAFASELPQLMRILCNNALVLDLVVITQGSADYMQKVRRNLEQLVRQSALGRLLDDQNLRFIARELLDDTAFHTLCAGANAVLDDTRSILIQLEELTRKRTENEEASLTLPALPQEPPQAPAAALPMGYGGFMADGAYQILLHQGQQPPMPYSYVMANATFGTLVTESGGGYTWANNSAEQKLTPWYNEPVGDITGETVRIQVGQQPWQMLFAGARAVRYAQGCAYYEIPVQGVSFQVRIFADLQQQCKYALVQIENRSGTPQDIQLQTKAVWLMGTKPEPALRKIRMCAFPCGVCAQNIRTPMGFAYLKAIGQTPAAVYPAPGGGFGVGRSSACALGWQIRLDGGETARLGWALGYAADPQLRSPLDFTAAEHACAAVNAHWQRFLSRVQIDTPDPALNHLVNAWLPYQVLACRMLARTAYYQAGGAYGFRDQLQDAVSLLFYDPQIAKEQILRSCAHQFLQGDVQHWWHEPNLGVRTRISDDLLFLPWAVCAYVRATGDQALLFEQTPFLLGGEIPPGKEDLFEAPPTSENTASVLEHCRLAIERASRFGRHGLVLMGTGDWNDAMNAVGAKGHGESVFCSWFLYLVLTQFASLLDAMDMSEQAGTYRKSAQQLQSAIEQHAWDGRWYRRAYFDDGTPMGTQSAQECQIDLIAQSWAVLSGAADEKRAKMAIEYAYRFLFDRTNQTVRLMTPPFENSVPSPGYIAAYPPGVRENGGQYTHGAIWFLIALCRLGDMERAMEILHAILPTTHADTPERAEKYAVEPYVMAADVYDGDYPGRGGWTWYTGAAGWMLNAVLGSVLGVQMRDGKIDICPPETLGWEAFDITMHGQRWKCRKTNGKWVVEQTPIL